jgi:transposase
MIPIPSGVRVWIATGHTDMRRGMQGLALTVQESLKRDPHAGDLYIFRGRREVHLALGVIGRGVDLARPDGLYAGRDRLEKSATDVATAERRLIQIKYWTTWILGRHKSLNL